MGNLPAYGDMAFKDAWQIDKQYQFNNTSYDICDVVTYNNGLYVAIGVPVIGVAPDKAPANWLLIAKIAAAQVQSDWTQANTSAVDYIKNKPIIPAITVTTLTTFPTGQNFGFSSSPGTGSGTAPVFSNQKMWMEANFSSKSLRIFGTFTITLTQGAKNWIIQLQIPRYDVNNTPIQLPIINTDMMYINFTDEQAFMMGGTQPYVWSTSASAGNLNVINVPPPGGAVSTTITVNVNFEIITTFTTT